MLFTESAEGGAGVLRRLHSEPDALASAARKALQIIHFTPDGTDLGSAEGARERCEKACYDCLLSYANQYEHDVIDRHAVRDLLLELASATTTAATAEQSHGDQAEQLRAQCDSELERDFIDLLISHEFALPDAVRATIAGVTAHFVFHGADAGLAVFVEPGPSGDAGEVEETLMNAGYSALWLHPGEDWLTQVRHHSYVFGEGRV
jgi:hypothetical protein